MPDHIFLSYARKDGRVPNLNPAFVREMEQRLGLRFVSESETPPPGPLPVNEEGEALSPAPGKQEVPSPPAGRGFRGGVNLPESRDRAEKTSPWNTPPKLWEKLKPLAREMRHEPTAAEDSLWQALRGQQLGGKFRRQHTIERFIVDFYCHEAGLIIEVDGESHDYTQEEDAVRQAFLESLGYRVIRFTNEEVLTELPSVLMVIKEALHREDLNPLFTEKGPGGEVFTPEDLFHYAYAIFHSPTYRARYAEFLKIDFPRLPLTSDVSLFRQLCEHGRALVNLHLMKNLPQTEITFPISGDSVIARGYPRYVEPKDGQRGRVYINPTQYFEGIAPDLWEFHIGGYQVLDKWLKDRRERTLRFEDAQHYKGIVFVLQETIQHMEAIDELIPVWPLP
ncbi:MAG: DUF559 domain-containing protein [Anaerolineae bacterium]|nr:DUF559 domain-containing protein [Anaerolineae bacterium]